MVHRANLYPDELQKLRSLVQLEITTCPSLTSFPEDSLELVSSNVNCHLLIQIHLWFPEIQF
jgi:hypothetical protein